MCDMNSSESISWSQYKGPIFSSATVLVVELSKYEFNFYSKDNRAMPTYFTRKGIVGFAHALLRLTPA
ncbi:hypothetical protein FBU31_002844, partial [Coemansia sp. 'formosensis']